MKNENKIKYDSEYISYVEHGDSAAVFIVRDLVKNIDTSGESQWFFKYQCRPDLGNSGADGGKLEAYTGAGNGTFPGAYFCI